MKPYWITEINNCTIGISPCPGELLNLELELNQVNLTECFLISLLTDEEEIMLGLTEEKSICETLGIEFLKFPIRDTSIPNFHHFVDIIDLLYLKTETTKKILIHCRAGIGRSSLIALGIMIKHGFPLKESIKHVSQLRGFDVPQSTSQRKLLSKYAEITQK